MFFVDLLWGWGVHSDPHPLMFADGLKVPKLCEQRKETARRVPALEVRNSDIVTTWLEETSGKFMFRGIPPQPRSIQPSKVT